MITRHCLLVACALETLALPAAAQTPKAQLLNDRVATLEQGMTRIAGVHERRDGRVVVLDSDDRVVYLVSADLKSAVPIGRSGSGPGEYRMPTRLFALVGDSTAILDMSNGRLLVVDPSGSADGMIDLRYSAESSNARSSSLPPPVTADQKGRLYAQSSPVVKLVDGGREAVDSAAILRWVPGHAPDTAGFVAVDASRYQIAGTSVSALPLPPFSATRRWAIARDGRVATVYPDPYHVVYYSAEGSRLEGPALSYQPIRVTEAHKQRYRDEAKRPRSTLVVRRGQSSPTVTTMSLPFKEPTNWPTVLPPFLNGASIEVAPDGRLWVERTTAATTGAPSYDIIDTAGSVVSTVQIPPSTRLVGFGAEVVYLVRRDEFDLEFLEQYRIPKFPIPR